MIQRRVPAKGVPSAASLKAWACAALERRRGELTIRIVDERESRALNRRYRGKRKPTNVLSFSYPSPESRVPSPVFGDIVICAPVVARESAAQGKRARAHWAHMVVHGVLHLLGYDHAHARDAGRMEARERAILASLSFPDPYEPLDERRPK